MFDIAIVGAGPAGISAAVTGDVRNKSIVIFGENKGSRKMRKAEMIYNYPGFPSISGTELAERFSEHLASRGLEVTADSITQIFDMGGIFSLQGKSGTVYEAKSVILAMGVVAAAAIPGEDENLGMGVSYCATCDAPLYKGKTVAVISYSKDEEREARFLAETAARVIYIPVYKGETELGADNIEVIREKPLSVGTRGKSVTTDKAEYPVDGVFILRESVAPKNLIYGLETDGAHIAVQRDCSTSVKGVFAAGDITGKPYQFAKAAGEGNTAVLSAVKYIDESK